MPALLDDPNVTPPAQEGAPAGTRTREVLALNLAGKVQRTTRNGREYLVAPLTLIVPGVLPGSRGRLYYPPDEVARNAEDWNDVPIVLDHPKANGAHVSGRQPAVLDRVKVGRVYNARVHQQKLKADGWFDVENTRRVSPGLLGALENSQPVELSTGLYVNTEPVQNGKDPATGREYDYVARNYKPDHLAILLNTTGACSIRDGCGVLVNSLNGGLGPMDQLLRNTYAGRTDFWEGVARLNVFAVASALGQAPAATPTPTTETDPTANQQPSDELDMDPEKACQIIKDGEVHGKELTEAQRGMFGALCGEREEPADNQITDADKAAVIGKLFGNANPNQARHDNGRWETQHANDLRAAIRRGFLNAIEPDKKGRAGYDQELTPPGDGVWTDKPDADDKAAARAHSPNTLTKSQPTPAAGPPTIPQPAAGGSPGSASASTSTSSTGAGSTANSHEGNVMPLTNEQREVIVNGLVGNCGCGGQKLPWADKDKAALNAMTDAELMTMDECRKAMAETVKNARFSDPSGNRYRLEPTTNQLVLETPAQGNQQQSGNGHQQTSTPAPTALSGLVGNQQQLTPEQIVAMLPPDWQQTLNFAQGVMQQRREEVIGEIVANLSGEQRVQAINWLNVNPDTGKPRPLPELMTMRNIYAAQRPAVPPAPTLNYAGAFAPPAVHPVVNETPLEAPRMEFEPLRKAKA